MPCYKPLEAWRTKTGITFNKSESTHLSPLKLPCNQCIGCRLDRSRSWAVRCLHEASLHDKSIFITLTYNDENLPEHGSLKKSDFQKFIKRLRKTLSPKKIRYYMCGEYGDKLGRPHYHAIIFGHDFSDKKVHRIEKNIKSYRSATLEKLWPHGYSEISDVTFASAAYVARYVMKKITGDRAQSHYERIDEETGEIIQLEPEYNSMSLKPGIGHGWFEKYWKEAYYNDEIILRDGKKVKVPKYYDTQLEKLDPETFRNIKDCREQTGKNYQREQTPERLKTREKCAQSRLNQLKRKLK